MMPFPKDKDLPPGSTMAATVMRSESVREASANRIGRAIKQLAVEHVAPCDMVILCVEPGRGTPFVEGLMESIGSDPTAVIDPT
jgi:hypothetical protein